MSSAQRQEPFTGRYRPYIRRYSGKWFVCEIGEIRYFGFPKWRYAMDFCLAYLKAYEK